MSPKQRYQHDLNNMHLFADPAQSRAVDALQVLYEALAQKSANTNGFLRRVFSKPRVIPGIYLVGSVGRGKTYLMDMFYECLDQIEKERVHYHRFMLDIHEQLRSLPKSPDPLQIIGGQLAKQFRVLCLDEFHVTDVADAMLLTGLLASLYKHGVVLVMTSNCRIDNLYLNGLQRERFMQAIALLKDHSVEIDLQAGVDYRLERLVKAQTYIVSENLNNHVALQARFEELAPARIEYNKCLNIYNRDIRTIALADDLAWFDFFELCNTPRAAKDYLELAKMFHTIFISDVPAFTPADDSAAKRFMHLIDALYDHRVKLITTAQRAPQDLYHGKLLTGIFERTTSRLMEMASHDYLAQPHRI